MKTLVTRLFLVRHGATQLTAENRFSGAVGVDLSDEGRTQVRYLAARLAEEKIGAIFNGYITGSGIYARDHNYFC